MSEPNGDKRSVTTDALETLGMIIDDMQKRDAIHLAVEPVIAGEKMYPGDDIGLSNGKAFRAIAPAALGIVDPFIRGPIHEGQRFWLVVYPRQIRSLRHVWTHPAFPDTVDVAPLEISSKATSEKWLRDFIATADCPGYETVIAAAIDADDDYLHFSGFDAHGEIPPEFWDHVEVVTGRKLTNRPAYFSCSC
jgi:hypothetical protein